MVAGTGVLSGCTGMAVRSQSPEDSGDETGGKRRLVGDLTVPFGMHPIRVEAVGLVTQLPGTGSDPGPSPQRDALLGDMQRRGVLRPNEVLARPDTDLVLVRGYLRPGIQKGDHFDIEIRVPARSENKGLRGGWLMETRLTETAVLGGVVRSGDLLALAQGPVLVNPMADEMDKVEQSRGRILGGGVSLTSRQLGLVLKPDFQNVMYSAQVGASINRRFHTFRNGIQQGVARPKTDEFIELAVHPRYKDNIERYIRVIRALPLKESAEQQLARLQLLERQLVDPITSAAAALKLEALGKAGAETLKRGLASREAEVRFYAAEALAYLDERDAAAPLGQIARNEPAFRAYALAALSAMDDYAAYEALAELLAVESVETRYGAFRALWAMNPNDALVRGEKMADQFSYHVLHTEGTPLVHVTRSTRPEIVLFGDDQTLTAPFVIEAGKQILVTGRDDQSVTVSRFVPNEPDQKRVVSNRVDDVIRAIVELGGSYPDVVQALQQAKGKRALAARFEVDAVPGVGRTYIRDGDDPVDDPASGPVVYNPLPGLFSEPTRQAAGGIQPSDGDDALPPMDAEKPSRWKVFLGKMTGSGK